MPDNSRRTPIPVVCALIERNGTLLIAQRPRGKHLAGLWEFAGGKVNDGEEPAAAILREIQEELGCSIEITGALPHSIHHYERNSVAMIPFVARLARDSAEPHPHEHEAIAWVSPENLSSYNLAPADIPIIEDYARTKGERR